tara:strand:- start:683 stop:1756 length:1074 start_codon:yes stop_codon:yes gene_type:complete
MNFKKSKIIIFIINIISFFINKSLSLKENNYLLLIKLYQYKYKNIKFNIIFNQEIINDNYLLIKLIKKNRNMKIISINFSKNILKNKTTMKRAKKCLDYWIPLVIKLSSKVKNNLCINLNCGDIGTSDYLSMNSEKNTNLIPDLYSFNAAKRINKKLKAISFEEFKKIWINKKSEIYWRGSTTGNPYKDIKELSSLKRIEICKKFRKNKNIDIKISRIIQNGTNKRTIEKYLMHEKIFAKVVSENKFTYYRYYPDIPGNSLAWGTITKYLAGSLIFKSEYEKKLYYYKLLKPWTHYIPVNNDFSDLEEKLIWSKNNIAKSLKIAYSGYIVILEYLKNIDNHFINTSLLYLKNNDLNY